jgi:hypothetical protein
MKLVSFSSSVGMVLRIAARNAGLLQTKPVG